MILQTLLTRRPTAVVLALMVVTSRVGAQGAPSAVDSFPARLTRWFTSTDTGLAPGCVVGVDRRGKPTEFRAYGLRHLESPVANDTATVMEAGSISKQVTAMAVMLLVEAGKVALDDDMRRYFPEWPASMPRITLRQMLHHQSGLREWSDLVEVQGWPRGTRAAVQSQMIALVLRQRGLNFPPGSEYFYSNSNYLLLSELVARVSGKSFVDFTHERIFVPLGMTRTQWRDAFARVVPQRATGFGPAGKGRWQVDMPFEDVIGAGGLLTTVSDLLTWLRHLDAPTIVSRATLTAMETRGVLTTGYTTSYALGLEVDTLGGVRIVTHGGATAGYRAYAGRVPSLGVRVALLCNAAPVNSEEVGQRVMVAAAGLTLAPANSASATELGGAATDPARARLGGDYSSTRSRAPILVVAKRDGLTLGGSLVFRPSGPRAFATADGQRRMVFEGVDGAVPRHFWLFQRGDSIRFIRQAQWTPTTADRRALVGRFRNRDADAEWVITLASDTLRVSTPTGRFSDWISPVYRDAWEFDSEGWIIVARRDARGRVTGFDAGRGRTRTLTFERVP